MSADDKARVDAIEQVIFQIVYVGVFLASSLSSLISNSPVACRCFPSYVYSRHPKYGHPNLSYPTYQVLYLCSQERGLYVGLSSCLFFSYFINLKQHFKLLVLEVSGFRGFGGELFRHCRQHKQRANQLN